MLFGRDMFSKLHYSNGEASLTFFVCFSILFYFIILNVYAAIVMRTYDNLRQKKQLMTEALAEIYTKQAQDHTKWMWNIICCRMERIPTD